MKVKAQRITEFLDGGNQCFMIPVFQRPYEWTTKEHCQILWDDLRIVSESNNPKPHFFGAIVRVVNPDTEESIIIDGQQRITTVSLLMLAIAHKLKYIKESNSNLDLPNEKDVLRMCLNYRGKQKLKLKLSQKDNIAYECVVNQEECPDSKHSKIIQAYNFFLSKLTQENINEIFDATHYLEIVDILLGKDDDEPQVVFESFNFKGLQLSDSDAICNFLLMGIQDYTTQEMLYEKYWQKIEQNSGFSPKDTDTFLWRFLQYKTNEPSGTKGLYAQFKRYYENTNSDKESILIELSYMSEIYKNIIQYKVKLPGQEIISDKINLKIKRILQELKMDTVTPFLMDVVREFYNNKLPEENFAELLDVLESYIVRRAINRMPTAAYNAFFLIIIKDIRKILSKRIYGNDYLDIFKYLIYHAQSRNANPADSIVYEILINNGLYDVAARVCGFILENIEKHHNPKEFVDTSMLTIEHIMPKTITGVWGDEWKKDLGDNWAEIHDKYLHNLGNLTLTGYNSEYSNRPFSQKKSLPQTGFDYSPLYLNSFMKNTNVWGKEQIEKRARVLAKEVLNLWPTYKPYNEYGVKDIGKFTLEDDYQQFVLRRKPEMATIQLLNESKEVRVDSWKDLYCQIINLLYNNDSYKKGMQRVFDFAGTNNMFNDIISDRPVNYGKNGEVFWEQIIPGISVYFRTNKSSIDLLSALKTWFGVLDISLDDFEIYLRDK